MLITQNSSSDRLICVMTVATPSKKKRESERKIETEADRLRERETKREIEMDRLTH